MKTEITYTKMGRTTVIIFLLMVTLSTSTLANGGRWKNYTVADGLVSPDVTVIFQDRLGALWIGTGSGGVSRFDGENFRSFSKPSGLPGGSIRQILDDKWDNLWFIIANGEDPRQGKLLYRYDGEVFHQVTDRDGLPGGVLDVVLKDRNGNIWFAGGYGLVKYDGKRFRRLSDNEFQQFVSAQSGDRGRISAIFESKNGGIWLGGGAGMGPPGGPRETRERRFAHVILYDGSKFHYFPLESFSDFPFPSINAIEEDNFGSVWFGGRSILLKYDGKNFESLINKASRPVGQASLLVMQLPPPEVPAPRTQIQFIDSIFKDSNGRLWFNSREFVSYWDGKELRHIVIPENWDEVKDYIQLGKDGLPNFLPGKLVLEDAQKNLWFIGNNGVHRFDSKAFQTFTIDDGLGSDNVSVILEAIDGKFWFGHDNGVTHFDPTPSIIQNFTMRAALGSDSVQFIHEDKQGLIWFTVRGGVARYNGQKFQYFSGKSMGDLSPSFAPPGLPFDINFSMSILDGGNKGLWFVGRETNQIFRYKDGVFQRYSLGNDRPRGINRSSIGSGYRFPRPDAMGKPILVVDPEGNLWFAVGESLIRCDGRDFQVLTENGFRPHPPTPPPGGGPPPGDRMNMRRGISDIHIDSQGNIWIATIGDGIKRYDGTKLRAFTTVDGVKDSNIRKIFEDKQKFLWFAGEQNLICYDGKSFQSFPVSNTTSPPAAIYQDNSGVVTFIYPDAIAKYNGAKLVFLSQDDTSGGLLGDKIIRASAIDSSDNLWLATNHGVAKYDGQQLMTYSAEDGLLVNDIRDVQEDSQGNLWCATWGGGVALYNGENFQAITTKDGLIHNNVRGLFEDSQGNMWFATDGGVTKYTLKTDILPRVKLTKVIAKYTYTDFSQELHFSDDIHRLTFTYQGIATHQTKLLYTYKLEGHDADWSEPSTEKQVEYNGLRPGNYTFMVKALREGSPYSNPPVAVKFTIAQPFWGQSQFYLPTSIGAIAIISLVLLGHRLIVQRKRAVALHIELRQKEEAEIQRVKKELNDAREIQMGLLPHASPKINQFDLAGISLPAREVGGDFYGYLTLEDGLVIVALADVSGKGLRGAMNAVMSYGLLREVARVESQAGSIMSQLNNGLHPLLQESMFTALNLGILDPKTKQIRYANAGQPFPILKSGSEVSKVELGGLPLGIMANVGYDEAVINLNPGDYIIFYTDGINEAMNEAEEIYGYDRLNNAISNAMPNLSAEEMIQHILQDVNAFVGNAEQYDDMTVVVLRSL